VSLSQELSTSIAGMPAEDFVMFRTTASQDRREQLLSKLRTTVSNLEGAFELVWQDGEIVLQRVLDLPLSYGKVLANKLETTLANKR